MGISADLPSKKQKPWMVNPTTAGSVFAAAGMLDGSFQCQVASETFPTIGVIFQWTVSIWKSGLGFGLGTLIGVQVPPSLPNSDTTILVSTDSLFMGARSIECTWPLWSWSPKTKSLVMVAGILVSHWNENSLIIFQGLSAVPGAGA